MTIVKQVFQVIRVYKLVEKYIIYSEIYQVVTATPKFRRLSFGVTAPTTGVHYLEFDSACTGVPQHLHLRSSSC